MSFWARIPRSSGVRQFSPLTLPGLAGAPKPGTPWSTPPADFRGSPGEWAIYWAHLAMRLGEEGSLWRFQPGFFLQIARFIPDFAELDVRVTINVRNVGPVTPKEAREIHNEILRWAVASGAGYQHTVILSNDALENPVKMLTMARTTPGSLKPR